MGYSFYLGIDQGELSLPNKQHLKESLPTCFEIERGLAPYKLWVEIAFTYRQLCIICIIIRDILTCLSASVFQFFPLDL